MSKQKDDITEGPEMVKDSSVTKEVAELKAELKELKKIVARQDERIKRLEEKLA
jgi:ubiquinone biosynthesis protein UbiJ